MMLRSRNPNVMNAQAPAGKQGDHPVKRQAAQQIVEGKENSGGEPKPKRAVLSELRNQISSGLVIDSTRKNKKRSNSSTEIVEVPEENKQSRSGDDSVIIVAEQVVDPCPEYDYDAENTGDPYNVPDYAFDIFRYYRSREVDFHVPNYLERQTKLNKDARAILVDWMIEVQETFELNHETLYLAVKLVDLYIAKTPDLVARAELQLIACAAVFIAAKYDERQPPLIDDFLYVAEDSFKKEDMEDMEKKMLKTVCFDLGSPLSYRFLRRYAKASKVNMQILTLARYILETSLMYFDFATASESKVAAGAFLLALRMKDEKAEWTPVLHKYSGLPAAEVEKWCEEMLHMMHIKKSEQGVHARLKTAFNKYSHTVFFESAIIPLPANKFDLSRPMQVPH